MKSIVALVAMLWALAPTGKAEVADASANGFTIKITTSIHASPTDVYKKLIAVGDWWNPQHTYSGDAHNLSIEERPGGCFCEKLPNGGVRHMEVLFFQTGKALRLSGGLGPLQVIGAGGVLSFGLTLEKDGAKLELTYVVNGYLPQGLSAWAAPVDNVLGEQMTRLKSYVETGNPNGPGKQEK